MKASFPQWCSQQVATCPLICIDEFGLGAMKNICDTATLQYDCICAGGHRPNVNEYTQTIHYFTCTYDQQACVHNCPAGDAKCTTDCEKNFMCGAAHPRHNNSTVILPPIGNAANEQASKKPENPSTRSGTVEQLKPIPHGGMTYLSASNSVHDYHRAVAGLLALGVTSLALCV